MKFGAGLVIFAGALVISDCDLAKSGLGLMVVESAPTIGGRGPVTWQGGCMGLGVGRGDGGFLRFFFRVFFQTFFRSGSKGVAGGGFVSVASGEPLN